MEAGYGTAEDVSFTTYKKAPFVSEHRPFTVTSLLVSLILPWLVYSVVFALSSYDVSTALCYLVLVLVFVQGIHAMWVWWKSTDQELPGRSPSWYLFVFVTSLLGWIVGLSMGNANFNLNLAPFNTVQSMNLYTSVNPEYSRGQAVMDAGRILFTPGSFLDLTKSMGFKNWNTYCVAPIVGNVNHTGPYDFWAVGLNCCPPGPAQSQLSSQTAYTCGAYNDPLASAGLRLMKDEQRPYFRLAVQQAEAAYGIYSVQPVFLYWMLDPIAEINAYKSNAAKALLCGILSALAIQAFFVISAALVFARKGW